MSRDRQWEMCWVLPVSPPSPPTAPSRLKPLTQQYKPPALAPLRLWWSRYLALAPAWVTVYHNRSNCDKLPLASTHRSLQINSLCLCIASLGINSCHLCLKCPNSRSETRLNTQFQRKEFLEIWEGHFTSLLLQICKNLQCINELGILNMSPLMLLKALDWQHIFKV